MVSAKGISAKDFRTGILSAVPEQCKKHFRFHKMLNCYYADYRPKWPEKTDADFLIVVDWVSGDTRLYADTAAVPIVRTFRNFGQLLKVLKGMEVV